MKVSTYTPALLATLAYLSRAANETQDSAPTYQLGDDPGFSAEFLVGLQNALSRGADISPILGVVKDVKPGDFSSYHEQFYKLANETRAQVDSAENAFDPVNVRDT